jgi:hypothetical protein
MSIQERSLFPAGAPSPRAGIWRLWRRLSFYGFLLVAGVAVASAAYPPPAAPPAAPDNPRPDGVLTSAPAPASSLDEPLRLLALAQQSFRGVRDYQCRMVKRERIDGRLQPQNSMLMYARTAPFSIFFRWLEPASVAGQEVCYVAGRYGNNLRVRPRGLLGAVGFVTLDLNDPRVRQSSRHVITDAGIGPLINQLSAGWQKERVWKMTQVQLAEYTFDGKRCIRVDMIHPATRDRRFLHARDVVYFDKDTHHLPLRMEAYDWPRRAGEAGELLEMYSYVDLRLNVGLRDDVFNH